MRLHIDISGQVQQKNLNSALGCKRDDGEERSVFLKSKLKKEILKKYSDQKNIIERVHCILVYYCIKGFLNGVDKIVICKDVNFRRMKKLLLMLFGDRLKDIKIVQRKSNSEKSLAHGIALKTKRHKKHAQLNITRSMLEDLLIENMK